MRRFILYRWLICCWVGILSLSYDSGLPASMIGGQDTVPTADSSIAPTKEKLEKAADIRKAIDALYEPRINRDEVFDRIASFGIDAIPPLMTAIESGASLMAMRGTEVLARIWVTGDPLTSAEAEKRLKELAASRHPERSREAAALLKVEDGLRLEAADKKWLAANPGAVSQRLSVAGPEGGRVYEMRCSVDGIFSGVVYETIGKERRQRIIEPSTRDQMKEKHPDALAFFLRRQEEAKVTFGEMYRMRDEAEEALAIQEKRPLVPEKPATKLENAALGASKDNPVPPGSMSSKELSSGRRGDPDRIDAIIAKEMDLLQGEWTQDVKPALFNRLRKVKRKLLEGKAEFTGFDKDDNVLFVYTCRYEVVVRNPVRMIQFGAKTWTEGPKKGSVEMEPEEFIYRVHKNESIELEGFQLTETNTAPTFQKWTRISSSSKSTNSDDKSK